ncbi:histidine kinase [Corallococcus praedator]|uniref:histidine kinase n=1 Tax=Corallococcus praedator TaxID=2316724 RepID=A0ABX9QAK7_9BACT|nr:MULTISPECIES: ATP-binding protein [Corallococcus]RKH07343.1 histidine kinase [Corallococcus sp. CA047B]RKH32332.1 histidine kinase [Corallococcus sp. CA031C]RKH97381.1 histidine kinase [Corallococcus praedator]
MSGPPSGGPWDTLGAPRRESALQRRLSLGDLLDLPSFSEVVKGFSDLYRVGIKVLDVRGTKLADVKVGHGDFCAYVFSFPDGRHACTAMVGRVKDGPVLPEAGGRVADGGEASEASGLIALTCFTGLRYVVMPVRWDGDLLGRVILGPFTPEELADFPDTLTGIQGLDLERAHELLARVRRVPERTAAQVLGHFGLVLGALVASGQKSYLATHLHLESTLEVHRELEAQNARLLQANTRLKELDRLKSSFLGTVSHELRTPLASILGYSEMMAEGLAGPLNPEQLQYVRTIVEKGETLLSMISSLLDLSQIEAGRLRLSMAPVDPGYIIQTAVSSVLPQAQRKGLELEVRLPHTPQPRLAGDLDKLRQVVVNLLANAVKFTPSGGRVKVTLSDAAMQQELGVPGYRISVEDTGVGIRTEEFERIFQSFYQVDGSSTREFGGAGLGLAIVKSLVEGHGGRVRVESEFGHGSRFIVQLPLHPPMPERGLSAAPPLPEPDRF